MRGWLAVSVIGLGCAVGPAPSDDLCAEMDPICDCNGEQVLGTCEDGEVTCFCPGGSGGESLADGGSPSGGDSGVGGAIPNGSGGATASGGAPGVGGESSGGDSSGGTGSGGAIGSGGSGSGGSPPAMCTGSGSPCAGSGDRTYYCGGEPQSPTCKGCSPGWCNCSQGPTYEPGGVQDACTYNDFYPYSCSIVCQFCIDDPESCE